VPRLETVENGGMARTLQQQPYGLASKLFAECFGTFFYVFMGLDFN
jgi:hypothetical protein